MLEKSTIHSNAPPAPYNEVGTAPAAHCYSAFQTVRNSLSQPGAGEPMSPNYSFERTSPAPRSMSLNSNTLGVMRALAHRAMAAPGILLP